MYTRRINFYKEPVLRFRKGFIMYLLWRIALNPITKANIVLQTQFPMRNEILIRSYTEKIAYLYL